MTRPIRPRPIAQRADYPLFDRFWGWLRLAPGAALLALPAAASADATVPTRKPRTPATDQRPTPPRTLPPQVKGGKPAPIPPQPPVKVDVDGGLPAVKDPPRPLPPEPAVPPPRDRDVRIRGGVGRVVPRPPPGGDGRADTVRAEKTPCPLPPSKAPPLKPGGLPAPSPPTPPSPPKARPPAKPGPADVPHVDGFGAHVVPPASPARPTRTAWLPIHAHGPDEPCALTPWPPDDDLA